jgi:menaquinone-dependent protoporphyrinogen oxidase
MAKILLVYGTTEGHTAQIAQRMAATMRAANHEVDVRDSKDLRKSTIKGGYDGVLVGGSVHAGEHQSSVREFVRRNRELLDGLPSAFFSVSLTVVEMDEEARRETNAMVDKFVRETGWQPSCVETIAGALVYSQYNIFVRHLMKLIAKREGARRIRLMTTITLTGTPSRSSRMTSQKAWRPDCSVRELLTAPVRSPQ